MPKNHYEGHLGLNKNRTKGKKKDNKRKGKKEKYER
jgi:hypothetical protein